MWKVYQNAVYWIDLKSAQDRGDLHFWPRSKAIILDNSVPADCLEKVVHTKTDEILNEKIHLSPRLAPKVVLRGCVASPKRRPSSTRG